MDDLNRHSLKLPLRRKLPKIKAEELPDNIKDVKDEILNNAIECKTSKNFLK